MKHIFILLAAILISSNAIAAPASPRTDESLYFDFSQKVTTATRRPVERWKVAENMVVITAAEIEEMHAHTVAEILNRAPGIFVSSTQDFGATSLLTAQGSEDRHMLVLLDGMEWNYLMDGHAETNNIPVGIINRIEIVKGPGSSTWGSSLGGVINIITKGAGTTTTPHGNLASTYGERGSAENSAEIGGRFGHLGYYVYGGVQHSDGLVPSRGFNGKSTFGKARYTFGHTAKLNISAGHVDRDTNFGDFVSSNFSSALGEEIYFINPSFEARLFNNFKLSLSLYHKETKPATNTDILSSGDPLLKVKYREKLTAGSGKLSWRHGANSAVFGVDWKHGDLDQVIQSGTLYQSAGAPEIIHLSPDTTEWATYTNATFVLGDFSITPGVRYDHNDITGSFFSPSIGVTFRPYTHTVFRGSLSRGFTVPGLSVTSGGGLFLDPNPHIAPEEVWSYQGSIETKTIKLIRLKATLFYHDLKNSQVREARAGGAPLYNDMFINKGSVTRKGMEFEFETTPLHYTSIAGNFSFADISPHNESNASDLYTANISLKYDNPNIVSAVLTGNLHWMDLPQEEGTEYGDPIWDMDIYRTFNLAGHDLTLSCKWSNIFNGQRQLNGDSGNPGQWVEAGIRLTF